MSFHLLKLIRHEIAKSNWDKNKKLVIWTACCVAFFGSFRLREILPRESLENSWESLKWKQVVFTQKNSVIINIKSPKVFRKMKGDFVDLLEIKDTNCCPYTALKKMAVYHKERVKNNNLVFAFSDSDPLTPKKFTDTIKGLLFKHVGNAANQLTGHSFRAGIPAALAEHPDLASDHEIMIWGR
jgi:hypothetical protein